MIPSDENRLQDAILDAVRGAPVTLFLVIGVRLQGTIEATDRFALLPVREGTAQLVYKHAISSCLPADEFPHAGAPAGNERAVERLA